MQAWLLFLASIANELYELFSYVTAGKPDPEQEMRLAMRIVRKASDEQARREITGP